MTPPASRSSFMPRLYEATSVPSAVAQRHEELALGVLAVDEQRAREADRHLRDADEVLDVAGQDAGSKE